MARQPIRVGARGSRLSLAQAETVRAAIARALGDDGAAELVRFVTTGDRIQDRTLAEIGGKGLFTKEIEEALAGGRIDCAVHSLKDMPTEVTPGLVIAATPRREDARDALVSRRYPSLEALPPGARVGTASLRREAQLLRRRPDLAVFALRGNVDTRLGKLDAGEADALVLASAGLRRLGLGDRIAACLDPIAAPPAPGQGALAVQTRVEDAERAWLMALKDAPTALATTAERAALGALDGSCRTAIGAYAWIDADRLRLVAEALTPDGAAAFRAEGKMGADAGEAAAAALGARIGAEIKAKAGDRLAKSS